MCSWRHIQSPLIFTAEQISLINGETTVELDESLFGKKRKSVGEHPRGAKHEKYSVFGIVEKSGRRSVLYIVPNRKRETLLPLIRKHISTDCHINHDGFVVYNNLAAEGYSHSVVNHNLEFVTPERIHTNTIEGLWGLIKQRIARMHGLPSVDSLAALLDDSLTGKFTPLTVRFGFL